MKILNNIWQFIFKRKITAAIILVALIVGGYFAVQAFTGKTVATRYVLAAVENGTIISSVTGSGSVSAENQLDVKSKVAGTVVSISAKKGQEVKAGDAIVQIDTGDAYKAVRDARVNLETAKLSLNKLKDSVTSLELIQAENDLTRAKATLEQLKQTQPLDIAKAEVAKENATDNIDMGYDDAFSNISDAFIDLPTIITGLEDVLYETDMSYDNESLISKGNDNNMSALMNSFFLSEQKLNFENLQTTTVSDYNNARVKYNANFENYKKITRYSGQEEINEELIETIDTVRAMSQAAKSEKNYLDTWVDYRVYNDLPTFQTVTDYQAELAGYIGQIDSHLSELTSTQTSLRDNKQALADADRDLDNYDYNNPYDLQSAELTVKEKEASLAELKAGPDALDLRSAELTVTQRQNDLADAQENLNDYLIRAPFDGVLASIDVSKGDDVSASTAVAVLITKQFMAETSLNEVDVSKVKADQKVTLTFDAVSDLTISGKVADVDIIGTVSQGVVNYNVKIVFDTQDERIRPGMSVSAAIITDIKQDVLTVPNAAVKTSGEISYVEMPDETVDAKAISNASGVTLSKALKQQAVTIGLANDSVTEITEGLKEGDVVISRTINSSSKTTASTSTSNRSLFQMGGPGR